MSRTEICRITGGILVAVIGVALGFAGAQLWKGGPATWPDLIANDTVVRRSAGVLFFLAALFLISGIAVVTRSPWGSGAAAVMLIVFVAIAFWGNYVLFGDIRLMHTGTNVIAAIIILTLLWFGSSR